LQAGAKRELCFHIRRRLEPAPSGELCFHIRRRLEPTPSGARCCALQMRIFMPAELQIRQDEGHCP
jgi:hypothetical protein